MTVEEWEIQRLLAEFNNNVEADLRLLRTCNMPLIQLLSTVQKARNNFRSIAWS